MSQRLASRTPEVTFSYLNLLLENVRSLIYTNVLTYEAKKKLLLDHLESHLRKMLLSSDHVMIICGHRGVTRK